MAVQAVGGDVALTTQKPLEGGIVPLKDLIPGLEPLQFGGYFGPEPLWVGDGAAVGLFVVLQSGLPGHVRRRWNLPGFLKQVVNLSLLYHTGTPVVI